MLSCAPHEPTILNIDSTGQCDCVVPCHMFTAHEKTQGATLITSPESEPSRLAAADNPKRRLRFHANVPRAAREVLEQWFESPLSPSERERIARIARSEYAGSAWKRFPSAGDDALRSFAWSVVFFSTDGVLATLKRRDAGDGTLLGKAIRADRSMARGKKSSRYEARSDEQADSVVRTDIPHRSFGLAASLIAQALLALRPGRNVLESRWPVAWKGDPSTSWDACESILIEIGLALDAIDREYADVIKAVPPVKYPLRAGADRRIYRAAVRAAAKQSFGKYYREAVADLVAAAFP